MASLIDKINKQMAAGGIKPRTIEARAWLGQQLSRMRIPSSRDDILSDPRRIVGQAFVGKMFLFHYDPKFKDTLPMWDKFPLVIPVEMYQDGFLGLNLHYLDPYGRLFLLDRLMDFINNDKYDDSTRFRLSYDLLSKSRRYRVIEPCVKRYLTNHIMSPLIYVEPDNWETAIFLPFQKMITKT